MQLITTPSNWSKPVSWMLARTIWWDITHTEFLQRGHCPLELTLAIGAPFSLGSREGRLAWVPDFTFPASGKSFCGQGLAHLTKRQSNTVWRKQSRCYLFHFLLIVGITHRNFLWKKLFGPSYRNWCFDGLCFLHWHSFLWRHGFLTFCIEVEVLRRIVQILAMLISQSSNSEWG